MRILVTDYLPEHGLTDGKVLIARNLFPRLRGHHLSLLCCGSPRAFEDHREELLQIFNEVHLVPRDRKMATLRTIAEAKLGMASTRIFQGRLRQLLAAERFDVVHHRGLAMAGISAGIPHPAPLLELIDCHTLFLKREASSLAAGAWAKYAATRLLEAATIRRFRFCTTVAEPDAAVVRKLSPQTAVHVIPNGVDTRHFAPMPVAEDSDTVIFTGAMSYGPNVRAALYFYQEIFPMIRRARPSARFIVAGREPAREILAMRSDPQVTVTGTVDDLRPWIAQAAVVVCPMVSGSGIKNKLLEALSMGRPVVSTPIGAEAIDGGNCWEVCVAKNAAAFATAVLVLLATPRLRQEVGRAGREFVLRNYTWDAAASRYDSLYSEVSACIPSSS